MKPVVIACLFVAACFGQVRLPTDPPLEGTKQLELGVEHTVPVQSENNEHYVIRMPSRKQPFHMYISPCNRPVHFNLRIPNHYALEPNTHPHSKHFNHILHMRIPPLIEFTEDLHSREKLILLAGEENEKRMEFFANSIEADYVVLNMSSNRQTSAKIFVTTLKSQLDHFYPLLPKDTSLAFSLNRSKSDSSDFDLHLEWPIPDYLKEKDGKDYRFCVLVSRNQPQYSICEESTEDLDAMHCVATNTSQLMLSGLGASERYYVTLFIHNMLSGGSSAYTPIEFRTPSNPTQTAPPKPPSQQASPHLENLQQLTDASLMKHRVELGSSNNYLYRLPSTIDGVKNIELVVHACNGYLRLAIYKNGELLRKTGDFIGLERFLINSVAGDQLRIQVLNDDKQPIHYWIWAGANYKLSPFVDMPIDRTVRVIKRYCNKAVLQFSRASNDENVRYCIHEKETKSYYFLDVVREPTEMCWANLPVGRKAVCLNSSAKESTTQDGQAMQFTITGLKPATTYRLDVSAQNSQQNSQPLPFRTVFIKTIDHC